MAAANNCRTEISGESWVSLFLPEIVILFLINYKNVTKIFNFFNFTLESGKRVWYDRDSEARHTIAELGDIKEMKG